MATLIIVAPVNRSSVLLAADGKRINAVDSTDSIAGCKILRMENLVFTAAGHTEGPSFSVHKIAQEVGRLQISFEQQLSVFEELLLAVLPDAVHRLVAATGQPFPLSTIVTTIFSGHVPGHIVRADRRFVLDDDAVRVDARRDFTDATLGPLSLFGSAAPDVTTFADNLMCRSQGPPDPVEYCRIVMEEAFRVRPDLVGPPISIVEVTAHRSRWLPGFSDPSWSA